MISINLQGGLGNQLFQIFTTIAYAIEHSHKFIFPYTEKILQRVTYWNNFLSALKMFTTANLIHRISNNDINHMETYGEVEFKYNEIPHRDRSDTFKINGYFQSYKYFEKYQQQISSLLRLDKQTESIKNEVCELFNVPTTIGMHFRLGDYKNLSGFHPIMPSVYYRDALAKIIEKGNISNARVLYFCEAEDNSTVNHTICMLQRFFDETECKLEFVKVNDDIVDWKQLLIMSCCNHNIIANSSFSWWGAYLNSNPEKIVCYPSLWFGQQMFDWYGYKDTVDLFPPNWNKIQI
jgi:hypothetical protein